ncbi:MAG: carboxypeptidase regulatory-like domain-containing protein [Acidobacteria bacterium]|nr:carboxypeptidase regulatory-like domain-containing protein [Acidobacteriota bacterium]MBI3426063.1 carboxypeptidase regulatory-like domain-containing protein [Acidobacteriota bacterium]
MKLSLTTLRHIGALFLGLATCVPVSAQSNNAAARPTGTGVISGRVSIGEKPVMGVVVGLMNGQTFNVSDTGAVVKATTDAEGRYRMNQVPAGSFRVAALAPGYVQTADNALPFEQGKAVNLREGETIENMDFTLARGGVVTGKVMDPAGKPLVEERLSVWQLDAQGRKTSWNPPGAAFPMIQTDDRGLYRIYGLAEGRYLLAAGTSGADNVIVTRVSGTTYKRTFYPDTTDETQAKAIEVSAGGEAKDIDIRLVADTVKGFGVLARVVDADTGVPVPNVRLMYSAIRGERGVMGGSMVIADPQGIARLDGLPTGRYSLTITNIGVGGSAPSDYFSDPVAFEILDGDVEMVEVRAKRGATISGVAVVEGVTDPTVLAKLSELQGSAFSRPSTPSATSMPSFGSNFKINRDGSFRLSGLAPGKVQINLANGRTPTGFSLHRIEVEGTPQQGGIEVAAGQQLNNVRLVLVYGQGVVRGQVQIVGGQLPEGGRVMVSARRTDSQVTGGGGPASPVDARGQFVIQGLSAGEYELTLTAMPKMTMTMVTTSSGNTGGNPANTGTTVVTTTTTTPPTPNPATSATPAFTPKTVKQKVIVPAVGEVPVAMTLDLTPAPPRGN